MLIPIVPIGNSKGIRLPKVILEQLQIGDAVELEVDNQQIILKPVNTRPREGWLLAFETMHENNDDTMLMPENLDNEVFEWEWK